MTNPSARRVAALMLAALLPAIRAAAQEAPRSRGFGAPVVKYTAIRDQGAVMFGARGGWYVTPSFMIGGGLYATVTEVDAPEGALPYAEGPLDVKFDAFGIDLEYAIRPEARLHPTLGASLGGCAVRFAKSGTNEQQDETSFAFLVEPSVGLELGVTRWLHLNLAISYRLVRGVDRPLLEDGDFRGPAAALALKLGRF